jgi:hypothetical protein
MGYSSSLRPQWINICVPYKKVTPALHRSMPERNSVYVMDRIRSPGRPAVACPVENRRHTA